MNTAPVYAGYHHTQPLASSLSRLDTFVEILASRGTSGIEPEAAEPGDIVDDWGNLSAMTRSAAGDLMDRLAEEEAAAGLEEW